ncbi:transcriptional regulator, SARP family [Kribbella flavida DSM 17836]|uniref:Transcriptional regulator, SARP family n=1 Tax=Kribbella flavida (strain DSM 17836 / JCM 10339 / NBRC 14399) TaxID=479435 RepID=D2PTQ9_KRIFD|nr:BTAD domain-containing putative transcriptional regulator [Kribbella flavida]ADB31372.1 transcriptional regulator, SARP family [Kribbella flavida DSM 17836]
MEFRLLGPVEVLDDSGRRIELAANRLRVLLAALLLQPNRVVAGQELMDTLWEEDLPARPRAALQTYVSRLRTLLGRPLIRTEAAGYVIAVDAGDIDLTRFRDLVGASTETTDAGERVQLLTAALALWRGEPLAGLVAGALIRDAIPTLTEERLHATALLLTARLEQGDHAAVTSELRGLTRRHPLRESLWALLMQAQIKAGRPADALATFSEASHRLADELGLDPGPGLRRLHQAVLATDARAAAVRSTREVIPHQLPTVGRTFVGRDAELAELDRVLLSSTGSIAVISGTAGVGKTALAVRWAERASVQFPDGQLYVNLRGFDPTGELVSPEDAVRGFLDALQMMPGRIPSGAAAQYALYRTLLANRRMLIVLDNARNAAQVRFLLPGGNTCRVVVTSRNALPGLLAAEGAHPLSLDLMDRDQARSLLGDAVGRQRLQAEPEAAEELVTLAARLPLALSLVAAHAAAHPSWSLEAVATDLRRTRQGLDVFAGEDEATDLRAVFSWSYQLVTATSARVFRLAGVHPGPDLPIAAVAALAGTTPGRVQPALDELERAHLLTQHSPGRYSTHDLLHVYAAELVRQHHERHDSLRRLLDYYLRTADAGDQWLRPHRDPDELPEPAGTPYAQSFGGYQEAFDWFEEEWTNLVALVEQAARREFDTHATQLARTITGFLERRGLWSTWVDVMATAVRACERSGDRAGQVMARRYRAHALARQQRLDEARVEAETALELAKHDRVAQAWCERMLAFVLAQQDRLKESFEHDLIASNLFKAAGHRTGQALALNSLGLLHASAFGEYEQALQNCREAQRLYQEVGHKLGEAATWDHLGYTYRAQSSHQDAISCYQKALALYRDLNDLYYQALMLQHLGDVQLELGDESAAGGSWASALALLTEIDHPAAEALNERLRALGSDLGDNRIASRGIHG